MKNPKNLGIFGENSRKFGEVWKVENPKIFGIFGEEPQNLGDFGGRETQNLHHFGGWMVENPQIFVICEEPQNLLGFGKVGKPKIFITFGEEPQNLP